MANPFWGNPAIAEYSPMSMQEIMAGPQELYKRDQAEIEKLDAMNNANLTLQGALGQHASKQEEFSSVYNKALENISKEGATPKNLELVKQAKQLYATHVLPMQDFAKKREALGLEYAKAKMDGRYVVQGVNPLDISFDDARKDPNALNSFKIVDKNTVGKMAESAGEAFGKSFRGPDESLVATHGIMQWVEGAKNPEDHANKMATDKSYRDSWNQAKQQVATANGLDLSDPNIDNLITSGMMSKAIGNVQPISMTKAQLDAIRKAGRPDELPEGPGAVGIDFMPTFPEPEGDTWDLAKKHSGVKTSVEQRLSDISRGEFKNMGDVDAALAKGAIGVYTGALGSITGFGPDTTTDPNGEYQKYVRAKEYKDMIQSELASSNTMKSGISLSYDRLRTGGFDNKITKDIDDYKKVLDDRLTDRFSQFKAANADDSKFYDNIVKGKTPLKGIEFIALQLRGGVDQDQNTGAIKDVYGIGDYVVNARVKYLDGKTEKEKQIQLRVLPQDAMDALHMFKKWNITNSDKTIVKSAENMIKNYHNLPTQ